MDLMIAEKQLMGLCDEQLENKGEKERKVTLKDLRSWGAWVAQLVKHPTLDFSSGQDLRVMRLQAWLGVCLRFSLSLSFCPSPAQAPCL